MMSRTPTDSSCSRARAAKFASQRGAPSGLDRLTKCRNAASPGA
jgi:hypothetical protein